MDSRLGSWLAPQVKLSFFFVWFGLLFVVVVVVCLVVCLFCFCSVVDV